MIIRMCEIVFGLMIGQFSNYESPSPLLEAGSFIYNESGVEARFDVLEAQSADQFCYDLESKAARSLDFCSTGGIKDQIEEVCGQGVLGMKFDSGEIEGSKPEQWFYAVNLDENSVALIENEKERKIAEGILRRQLQEPKHSYEYHFRFKCSERFGGFNYFLDLLGAW